MILKTSINSVSRSDWYSLDWSGAKHYQNCCQWMEKVSPFHVCTMGQHFKQFYYRQLKNRQLNKMSAKVSEMWTKCVFTRYDDKQSYRIV